MMTMYISPYRRLASMRQAMDRVLEESYAENAANERELALPIDVKSEEEGYTLIALVPGLNADDLNIEVLNNTVSLRGEFKFDTDENAKYVSCELPQGRFSRTITLPAALDSAKAEASLDNGVLKLYVPKAESYRPRTIKVNVN